MAFEVLCPFLYGHVQSGESGGILTVNLHNPMSAILDIIVTLLDMNWLPDGAAWRTEHTLIGPGETITFWWYLYIGRDQPLALGICGDWWPHDYTKPFLEIGRANVAYIYQN